MKVDLSKKKITHDIACGLSLFGGFSLKLIKNILIYHLFVIVVMSILSFSAYVNYFAYGFSEWNDFARLLHAIGIVFVVLISFCTGSGKDEETN